MKYDRDDEDRLLEGAQFEIFRPATDSDANPKEIICDGTEYAVVSIGETITTDENGYAKSPSLDCGRYFLVEIKAPDGYNTSKEGYAVTVVPKDVSQLPAVRIPNQRGRIIPETGGEGVSAFILSGVALLLAAALLAAKKRRAAN